MPESRNVKYVSAVLRIRCSLNKVRKQGKWVIPGDQNEICCVGRKAGGCDVGRWKNNTVMRCDAEDTQHQKLWTRVPIRGTPAFPVDPFPLTVTFWTLCLRTEGDVLAKRAQPSCHPYSIYRGQEKVQEAVGCSEQSWHVHPSQKPHQGSLSVKSRRGGQTKSKWMHGKWPRRLRAWAGSRLKTGAPQTGRNEFGFYLTLIT